MSQRTRTKPRTPAESVKTPIWFSTLPEVKYLMQIAVDEDGCRDFFQIIDMTREEFIALKTHLGTLRNYEAPEVQHA